MTEISTLMLRRLSIAGTVDADTTSHIVDKFLQSLDSKEDAEDTKE